MRKIKKIFIIALIVIFFLINVSFGTTGTVNSDVVRVREKPDASSEIVTNVYKDDKVEILDKESGWYKVEVEGKKGYIKSDFVNVKESENTNIETQNTNKQENKTEKTTNNSSNKTNENTTIEDRFYVISKTKIRIIPSLLSNYIGIVGEEKELTKLDTISNWTKVTDGTCIGWIPNSKILTSKNNTKKDNEDGNLNNNNNKPKETDTAKNDTTKENNSNNNKIAIINIDGARVRKSGDINADILDTLNENDEVKIISKENDWYKVTYKNGKEGYVNEVVITMKDEQSISSRSLPEGRQDEKEEIVENTLAVQDTVIETPAETTVPISSGSGQEVVNFASQFLGYPYVYAGKNPETGFDCSGFTKYVFSHFGYELGGSVASQIGAGREITRAELDAGDLLIFYNEGITQAGHAGIYIGGGEFIHAANPNRGVVTDNINSNTYYNTRYITAKRLVE